mmetsp:Transcript_4119/g.8053  ORF Transcript_4119/g.8053 Transcript_4119/m.8053 type:complete len:334 (-) Transcript_4119:69-1070(-)
MAVAAGLNATDTQAQKQVQRSIPYLLQHLPTVLKQAEHADELLECTTALENIEARETEGEAGERERRQEKARARTHLVSQLLQPRHVSGPLASHLLSSLREKMGVAKLKADLEKREREMQREKQASEEEDERSARNYLLFLAKLSAEKSKICLSFLLVKSEELGIDFLNLTGDELKVLLEVQDMPSIAKFFVDALRLLRKCKEGIEQKREDTDTLALRATEGLKTLLAGKVPPGMDATGGNDHLVDCTFYFCTEAPPSQCSDWGAEIRSIWSWLEGQVELWQSKEAKVDSALPHCEDIQEVAALIKELQALCLYSPERLGQLKERMAELLRDM